MPERISIKIIPTLSFLAGILVSSFGGYVLLNQSPSFEDDPSHLSAGISLANPFLYNFNADGVLQETGTSAESPSPYWWLNSGGKFIMEQKVGRTMQGTDPLLDKWRILYTVSNSLDTDNGTHPQNLFRLLTKLSAGNMGVESLFKIEKDNFSQSSNRNASNGLLLMSRYVDGNTLYYAGIRVDGTAVIKKKYHGTYYTMAQKQIFPGTYDRDNNVNLLPHKEWVGLRSETITNPNNSVTVRLRMKRGNESSWTTLLEATDTSANYGNTPAITSPGRSGIRTDFMDVSFESYRMEVL